MLEPLAKGQFALYLLIAASSVAVGALSDGATLAVLASRNDAWAAVAF